MSKRLSPFWHACILISYWVKGARFSRRVDCRWPTEKVRGVTLPSLSRTWYSTGIWGMRIPLEKQRGRGTDRSICVCYTKRSTTIFPVRKYTFKSLYLKGKYLSKRTIKKPTQDLVSECAVLFLKNCNISIWSYTLLVNKTKGTFHLKKGKVSYIFPRFTYS